MTSPSAGETGNYGRKFFYSTLIIIDPFFRLFFVQNTKWKQSKKTEKRAKMKNEKECARLQRSQQKTNEKWHR